MASQPDLTKNWQPKDIPIVAANLLDSLPAQESFSREHPGTLSSKAES